MRRESQYMMGWVVGHACPRGVYSGTRPKCHGDIKYKLRQNYKNNQSVFFSFLIKEKEKQKKVELIINK